MNVKLKSIKPCTHDDNEVMSFPDDIFTLMKSYAMLNIFKVQFFRFYKQNCIYYFYFPTKEDCLVHLRCSEYGGTMLIHHPNKVDLLGITFEKSFMYKYKVFIGYRYNALLPELEPEGFREKDGSFCIKFNKSTESTESMDYIEWKYAARLHKKQDKLFAGLRFASSVQFTFIENQSPHP